MKVTILVCDRCGRELNGEEVQDTKLDVALKFDDPGSSRLFPLRRREGIELCPSCRNAFADWLGDRGDAIPGLKLEDTGSAATVQRVRVAPPESSDDGETVEP